MTSEQLAERTMEFAVHILKLADSLPRTVSGRTIANQVARSGTSVAANYRAAFRGKSRADFVNKITTVLEEADETDFWIELGKRSGAITPAQVADLQCEAIELIKIFNAPRRTTRENL